jgi:hypothetical protein
VVRTSFLEIKANTDALHFIQELLRLSEVFRQRSPLQIDEVLARVEGWHFEIDTFPKAELAISEITRALLEAPTQADESTWILLFRTLQYETSIKELFSFDLHAIGGSHPLLIRLTICATPLYGLLADLLERCGALWDAKVVGFNDKEDILWDFFQRVDVRSYAWVSAFERTYFGESYERFAPSRERTRREKVVPYEASPQPVPDPLSSTVSSAAAPSQLFDSPAPQTEQPYSEMPRMYGPTEQKVTTVRQLLAEKRQGRHRNRPWSWACQRAEIDQKTAQKHLAAERTEWNTLNKKQQDRE